ncbi:hypothetical protein [Microbacterium arborescens]|nr:hypothetical protein [Microbacterium arborescens]RAZ33085.1 hypothetical protein DO944_07875 [Microbacterium sp. SMR1]
MSGYGFGARDMAPSPRGREISVVTGDAAAVVRRGGEIEDLGAQMIGAAGVLEAIADGADGQRGLSIEKIREVVGEIHEELRLAGERYEPTGAAVREYGESLSDVQQSMRPIVERCQAAWDAYVRAQQNYDETAGSAPLFPSPTPDDPGPSAAELAHERDVAQALTAQTNAHAEFVAEAETYDSAYDTWESAFELAASRIGTATSGGIQDSGWDDFDGFVEGALVVLQWVGIALAVAAFVIGGPIIAALGAIVALVTLGLTLYKAGRGNSDPFEIAVAVIGVIPFGSLAKFAGGARSGFTAVGSDLIGGLGTTAGRTDFALAFSRFGDTFSTARTFGAGGWTSFTTAMRGSSAMDDVAARLMGHGFAANANDALSTGGWGVVGTVAGHYGWIANTPGQIALATYDVISEASSPVDTWEAELARS